MDNVVFTYYAMIVKNLRGIALIKTINEDVLNRLNWLRNRFKYRNIGIPPVYYKLESNYFDNKIFRKLYYPVDEIVYLKNILVERGFEETFIEPVIMASIYISPLMLLSSEYVDIVEKYSIGKINICRELGVKDWKLHFRISDYTILDFYDKMVSLSIDYINSIKDNDIRIKILNERRKIVERDYKRYWRILCNSKYVYQYYLDPLLLIEENLGFFIETLSYKHASALSVIPVINLTLIK
ncbi:MAG: hypothetical protein QXX35_04135 [Desulfurococcaceae archaeon]